MTSPAAPSAIVRAVLDGAVYVSGLLRPEGPSGQVLQLAVSGAFAVVTSAAIVGDVLAALRRPAVRRELGARFDAETWLGAVQLLGVVVADAGGHVPVMGDVRDRYLAAARDGVATHLVTLDEELLRLGAVEGFQVVTPSAFVRALQP